MKKKRRVIHTATASTVVETLKALGLTQKDFLEVVKEIKKLENYEPFPMR